MIVENEKFADDNIKMENVIKELTQIVEEEVNAYQMLLDALVEQQVSIINRDIVLVSSSNKEVEKIIDKTREQEKEREGKSRTILYYPNGDGTIHLSDIIFHIEKKYARRLEELKKMLKVTSNKIQTTRRRNKYLLENSLEFVDGCLKLLANLQVRKRSYTKDGKIAVNGNSLNNGKG